MAPGLCVDVQAVQFELLILAASEMRTWGISTCIRSLNFSAFAEFVLVKILCSFMFLLDSKVPEFKGARQTCLIAVRKLCGLKSFETSMTWHCGIAQHDFDLCTECWQSPVPWGCCVALQTTHPTERNGPSNSRAKTCRQDVANAANDNILVKIITICNIS